MKQKKWKSRNGNNDLFRLCKPTTATSTDLDSISIDLDSISIDLDSIPIYMFSKVRSHSLKKQKYKQFISYG